MKHLNIPYQDCHQTGTIIHMAIDGIYAGHIVISDIIKPHSKAAIAELKKAGVEKCVMLTGDAKKVADQVTSSLGIDEVYSELLPADKVDKVEEFLRVKLGRAKLAFVGDGINDAPVLSRADIGIAMGAMGSDAAIEAADIVLMDDDPIKIAKAIKISRKCLRIVYQNIVMALAARHSGVKRPIRLPVQQMKGVPDNWGLFLCRRLQWGGHLLFRCKCWLFCSG